MEFDAAAPAPATETVIADQVATTTETTDDDYSAVFDRLMGEPEAQDVPEPQPEAPVEAAEAPVEAEPAPTDLPAGVKATWASLTPEAREAVAASHRDMSRKLAEQGRLVQGIAPIRDAMVEAAKLAPHMMNMTPQQVAAEVTQLVEYGQALNANPVATLAKLAKIHGVEGQLGQALSGQPVQDNTTALKNEIRALQSQLQRVADPGYIRDQFTQFKVQDSALDDVKTFASKAEHWAELEPHLPDLIPLVQKQLGAGASAQDVLSRAYDIGLSLYLPDAKATQAPAVEAQVVADPKRAEAVMKAKSVNVTGKPSGQQRELSEDERYAAVYERAYRK